jgi:hypothetical protein
MHHKQKKSMAKRRVTLAAEELKALVRARAKGPSWTENCAAPAPASVEGASGTGAGARACAGGRCIAGNCRHHCGRECCFQARAQAGPQQQCRRRPVCLCLWCFLRANFPLLLASACTRESVCASTTIHVDFVSDSSRHLPQWTRAALDTFDVVRPVAGDLRVLVVSAEALPLSFHS